MPGFAGAVAAPPRLLQSGAAGQCGLFVRQARADSGGGSGCNVGVQGGDAQSSMDGRVVGDQVEGCSGRLR